MIRPATVTGVLQPVATEPLSMKKKAVAANKPIEINQNEIPGIETSPINSTHLLEWGATIIGPPDTPYQNGIFNLDPLCDLDYAANEAKEISINNAISNSFGFGGTNGSIVISKLT